MVGFEAGPVSDVTVGGRPAKALVLTNSIDTQNLDCAGGLLLPLWKLPDGVEAATNGDATEQIWVVDVRGRPVIVDGETYRNSPAGARGEIEQIVPTIEFD
jgi:hypothetical protein